MLQGLTLPTLEQDSGLKIVMRALEEPLRRIVSNAADEPSIVLDRVDGASQRSFGYNAATRQYGDLLEMGVIDPAKVTRLALQNAGSIASLVLTIDCMIANAPKKEAAGAPGMGEQPEISAWPPSSTRSLICLKGKAPTPSVFVRTGTRRRFVLLDPRHVTVLPGMLKCRAWFP